MCTKFELPTKDAASEEWYNRIQYVSDPLLIKLNVIEFHELKEKCGQFFSPIVHHWQKIIFFKKELKNA